MKKRDRENTDRDDGRTVVDMNVEGFSWYRPKREKQTKEDPDRPTKKELRAMILAAYKAYLPYFLIVLGAFLCAFLLAYLWLT